MKNLYRYFFVLLFTASILPGFSQIVSKEQSKPASEASSAKEAQKPIDFSISRNDDIFMFENNMKMFENALSVKSVPEAEVFRDKNLQIAEREIARAKKNLAELKMGETKHLEEWRKENDKTDPLNIALEINQLTDNINSMQYRYKNLTNVNLNNLADERANTSIVSDMKIILKNMKKNLKYESDKKIINVERPPLNDTASLQGPAVITQKQPDQTLETGNQLLNDFYASRNVRVATYKQELIDYQNFIQKKEYKSAKRTFKTLNQTMQEELESNHWLKMQIDQGNITVNPETKAKLEQTIVTQQKLADEAGKIKIPLGNEAEIDRDESFKLLTDFESTLN